MDPLEQSAQQPRTVVVLGLARSGTSVVTGILKVLGVDMGPSVDDQANPRGSHEDLDFAHLHREIFERAGAGTGYWNPPPRQAILALAPQLESAIRGLLEKKSQGKSVWGWKHTRTLLTYELFLPHLVNPQFVLVFRNALATALSSVEHTRKFQNPLDFTQALKLVHFYHGEMMRFLDDHANVPTLLVSYEDVVADPQQEAARLASFLGLAPAETKTDDIAQFVIPRDKIRTEKRKMRSFWRGKLPRLISRFRHGPG
jgi:hypothetical protein